MPAQESYCSWVCVCRLNHISPHHHYILQHLNRYFLIYVRVLSFFSTALVEGRGLAKGEIGMASIDLKRPELLLSQVCFRIECDAFHYLHC